MATARETPDTSRGPWREWAPVVLIGVAGLALRLAVWRWHAQYPLGGDEQEYLQQALTLLREHRYVELRLMRPPLYTGFLAACIQLMDSLVQRLRLAQAVVGALTVLPAYGLGRALAGRRAGLACALIFALSYTLAASATELLTETLFLFGLCCALWLLLGGEPGPRRALAAGLAIGALALLRSVALPLAPLGALWLALAPRLAGAPARPWRRALAPPAALLLGAALAVAPWAARNYAAYGGLILVDTTGAENLWLDNDPAGREAVKRELYAMGEDRAGRQRVAMQRGLGAVLGDPARFAAKAGRELLAFFALQHADDMRDRPAIWVGPAEVWLRLLLGDALWLLLLLGGAAGMWLARGRAAAARWALAPWALYTLATALLFHVELRYRLPLFPALAPYAALLLAGPREGRGRNWRAAGAALTAAALAGLTLAHRPYLAEAAALAPKHLALWQAGRALAAGDPAAAEAQARRALAQDDGSALARVALARAALLRGDEAAALGELLAAERAIGAHPHAHLLRGAILRARGDAAGAAPELAYETASLEDLQAWAWDSFPAAAPPPAELRVGGGLDLGDVRGFYAADPGGFRWTAGEARVRLRAPAGPARLTIEVAPGAAPARLAVVAGGRVLADVALAPGWQAVAVDVGPGDAGPDGLVVTLRSGTFRPRAYDPASDDGRELGVMVRRAAVGGP